jgi:hypothetical protein
MEFGAQNQYGRVTCPSIGNFTWSKKKYTFGGQKGENRLPESKNGIWGPRSVWSWARGIYISFGNFIRSKKNYTFRGQKGENWLPETEFGAQKLSLGRKISMVV